MALNATSINCTINSFAEGAPKLAGEPGIVSAPKSESQTALGGFLQWTLLLDPSADIAVGDEVQLASMGAYRIDPRQRFSVKAVYPTAPPPYEAWGVWLIEKLQY